MSWTLRAERPLEGERRNRVELRGAVQILIATMLLVLLLLSPAMAAKKKKGGGGGGASAAQAEIASRRQEIARAKQALTVAQAQMTRAQATIARGQRTVEVKLGQIEKGKQDQNAFKSLLKDLEKEIERAQPRESEFARYKKELDEAERYLKLARGNVTNSVRYRASYERALKSSRRAELLSKLRDQVEKDETVVQRRRRRDGISERYKAARRKLLEANDEWVETGKSAREAGAAIATAREGITGALLTRNSGRSAYRDAAKLAAIALDAIREGEAVIKALGGAKGSGSSSGKKRR